jgi:hypothetical protein
MEMIMTLYDCERLWVETLMEPFQFRSPAAIADLFEQHLLPLLPAKTPASELMEVGIAHLRTKGIR